jgi:hypothetical protein
MFSPYLSIYLSLVHSDSFRFFPFPPLPPIPPLSMIRSVTTGPRRSCGGSAWSPSRSGAKLGTARHSKNTHYVTTGVEPGMIPVGYTMLRSRTIWHNLIISGNIWPYLIQSGSLWARDPCRTTSNLSSGTAERSAFERFCITHSKARTAARLIFQAAR